MADFTQDMAAGYGFEGGSVAVGRPFVDPAAPDDAVEVRIPLGMLNRHGLIAGRHRDRQDQDAAAAGRADLRRRAARSSRRT